MTWLTIDCERALYVDRGRDVILCDRLGSPITLVVKVSDEVLTNLTKSRREAVDRRRGFHVFPRRRHPSGRPS